MAGARHVLCGNKDSGDGQTDDKSLTTENCLIC